MLPTPGRVSPRLQTASGSGVMGFYLQCTVLQIFSAPKWQNHILDTNIVTGAKMVRTSSITMPNVVELGLQALRGGDIKFHVFLNFYWQLQRGPMV